MSGNHCFIPAPGFRTVGDMPAPEFILNLGTVLVAFWVLQDADGGWNVWSVASDPELVDTDDGLFGPYPSHDAALAEAWAMRDALVRVVFDELDAP